MIRKRRAAGYYWVRNKALIDITQWSGELWFFCGIEDGFTDDSVEVVSERISEPLDPRQLPRNPPC